ncbi:MAG: hypothetical protein ACP5IZ_08945 [Thermoprotei archaeon]|jgi:hypothetical protein
MLFDKEFVGRFNGKLMLACCCDERRVLDLIYNEFRNVGSNYLKLPKNVNISMKRFVDAFLEALKLI